jgi:hypothetical protein
VYGAVASTARRALDLSGPMYIHPYVAVLAADSGSASTELTTFEYEPSSALHLLAATDTTLVLCQVDAQGMCAENYLVFSQMARTGDRDAVVLVRSMGGSKRIRVLMMRLRYGRNGWAVVSSALVS